MKGLTVKLYIYFLSIYLFVFMKTFLRFIKTYSWYFYFHPHYNFHINDANQK